MQSILDFISIIKLLQQFELIQLLGPLSFWSLKILCLSQHVAEELPIQQIEFSCRLHGCRVHIYTSGQSPYIFPKQSPNCIRVHTAQVDT